MDFQRTKAQFRKALDWLVSLLIWITAILIASPVAGIAASFAVKAFNFGRGLF